MVSAKQVINSIKPNLTKAPPQGPTEKGSAGYDNIRDDIEKTKSLREGSVEKVPVNNNDIANKKYVDDEISDLTTSHLADHPHQDVTTTASPDFGNVTAEGTLFVNAVTSSAPQFLSFSNNADILIGTMDESSNSDGGGLRFRGWRDGNNGVGFNFQGRVKNDDGTELAGNLFSVSKAADATSAASAVSNTPIAIFRNYQTTKVTIDHDGQISTSAGITAQDDIAIGENAAGFTLKSNSGSGRYGLKYGAAGSIGGNDNLALTNRENNGDLLFQTSPGGGGGNEVDRMKIDGATGATDVVNDFTAGTIQADDGFTGTGSYTNFTIVGGIITAAS